MSAGALRTGSLRHRVRLERNDQSTDNDHGEPVPESWTTVATVWADVRPARPGEVQDADRVEGRAPMVIVTHRRTDVTGRMRAVLVNDGSKVLELVGPPENVSGMNRTMKLYAVHTEGVSA